MDEIMDGIRKWNSGWILPRKISAVFLVILPVFPLMPYKPIDTVGK